MYQRSSFFYCVIFTIGFLLFILFLLLVIKSSSTQHESSSTEAETELCPSDCKLVLLINGVHIDTCVQKTTCDVMQHFKMKMESCESDDFGDSCTSKICMQVLEYERCFSHDICRDLTVDTPFVNDCEKSCSKCPRGLPACVYNEIGNGDRVFERCAVSCDYSTLLSGTITRCNSFMDCSCCQKDTKNEKKMCLESNSPYYVYTKYLDEMNVKGYFAVLMAMALAMLF